MGRLKKEIRYQQRYKKIWSYKIDGHEWKSTGKTSKREAVKIAEEALKDKDNPEDSYLTFGEYAKDYFIVDKCPRALRLADEGKTPTKRYQSIQRLNLETHVLTTSFAKKRMRDIRRADIIDLRSRIVRNGLSASTVNKVMSAVKTVFNEAEYREDIVRNPVSKIGNLKEADTKVDIFTLDELHRLFNPETYDTIWNDRMGYLCFFLTFNTGMRRGEVLALRWKAINFQKKYITICEAWKDTNTIGTPKSGKERYTPISKDLLDMLKDYRKTCFTKDDSELVFAMLMEVDSERHGGRRILSMHL